MKARNDSWLETAETVWVGDASAEARRAEPAGAGGDAVPAEGREAPVFDRRASIQDPDGFTNVRRAPSGTSEILTAVYEGEVFRTFQQEGLWWQVRTSDGVTGCMHVSRIYLLD